MLLFICVFGMKKLSTIRYLVAEGIGLRKVHLVDDYGVLRTCVVIDSCAGQTEVLPWGMMKFWWQCWNTLSIAGNFGHLWSAEKKYWEGWHFDKGRKFMYNCRNCLQFPSYNFNEPGIHRLLKQGNNRLCGFGDYFWIKQCLFILWLLFYFHFIHFNKCFKKSAVVKQGSREGSRRGENSYYHCINA